MSPADERDIRGLLTGALDTITPAPAPVHGVVRRGKAMRTRRKIGIAAGVATAVAVLAAGAGLAPGLLHRLSHHAPSPLHHGKAVITVHPPENGAPPGEIAWGTVNGRHWQLITTRSGAISVDSAGAAAGSVPMSVTSPDPISFAGLSDNRVQAYYGAVRRDVTSVTVVLADGGTLKLRPVPVFGHRLAGFVTPVNAAISRITAYSGHRELAYALPFNGSGSASWGVMLRPGQPVPSRITRQIFAGPVLGTYHRIVVYLGPWGRCLEDYDPRGSSGNCSAPGPGLVGNAGVLMSQGPDQPGPVVGALGSPVASLMLTTADGRSIRVPLVTIGGLKYYSYVLTRHPRILFWSTFDAAGVQLSSGQGPPS